MLDPKTVAYMLTMLHLVLAAQLGLARLQARGLRGIGLCACGDLLAAVGLGLNLQQATVSPFISYVLGNTLIVAAMALVGVGFRRFTGNRPRWIMVWAPIAATLVVSIWFGVVQPDRAVRVAWVSTMLAALALQISTTLLAPIDRPLRLPYRLCGYTFLAYAVLMAARVVVSWVQAGDYMPYTSDLTNQITFVGSGLLGLITTFCFVLMINYHMAIDITRAASEDILTGALNRHGLKLYAARSIERAGMKEIGVIVFDIDQFKDLNVRYGHPAGDFILREMATVMHGLLRDEDLFARTGGEFCAVLAQSDEQATARIAERMREAWSAHPLQFAGDNLHVTLSAGVAAGPAAQGNLDELIATANRALNLAQQQGGDRLVRASGMSAKPVWPDADDIAALSSSGSPSGLAA